MIVGLDLSLTSTGVAVLEPGRDPRLARIRSKPVGADVRARGARLDALVQAIALVVLGDPRRPLRQPDYRGVTFYVEAPIYGRTQAAGAAHDRSGLWWLVATHVLDFHGRIAEVSPTAVKRFATGRGTASKPEMMAATTQQFPGVFFESDDDSDALWIAEIGEYLLAPDHARVSRTKTRDAVVAAVPAPSEA